MTAWLVRIALALLALLLLDRLLLWMEARRWINYRRTGLSRPGYAYHALEMHSIFEPGMEEVLEARVEEKEEQDEAGDPPAAHPVE